MKVLFASGSMQGGGAERVVSLLANAFVGRGWKVAVLVVRGESIYTLDEGVKLLRVYEESEITTATSNKIFRRFNYVPKLIAKVRAAKPDVIIPVHGGGWNAMFVLIARLLGVKVIAAEHISHTVGGFSFLRWAERHLVYCLADRVTVLTRFDFDHYRHFIRKLTLLPNPLSFRPLAELGMRVPVILAAGHLNRWSHKGFDNLLRVFAMVSPQHPEWRLEIAGSGEEGRGYLAQLAHELGVAERVHFLGFQRNIERVMQRASIFALSSRFEGFGMVLAEAMSQGCACVSFDCEAGPAEIITDGVDGLLVPNQDNVAMAIAVERLMVNGALRHRLALAGLDKAQNFSIEAIGQKWTVLFREMGLVT